MRGSLRAATAAVLLVGLLSACTGAPEAGPDETPQAEPTPRVASEDDVAALLERRGRAIQAGRRAAFVDTTAPGPGRRDQLEVFDVLDELSVGRASYVVSSVDQVGDQEVTRVGVLMLVRLDDIDPSPVAATHVLDLVPVGDGWRVKRDQLAKSELVNAPWELPDVRVRRAEGLAVLLDGRSEDQADRLVRLLQEGREATRDYVRYPFTRTVLVVAPSTVKPLRDSGLQPVEIQRTGAIVQQVDDRTGEFVSDRMVLTPTSLQGDEDRLLNVVRHELAHMAIDGRDAGMPLWVVEGLAEWASWRGEVQFRIATTAVEAAEAGLTEMPPDLDFRSDDNGTAYGIAWFAMRWLEQEHGGGAPYDLLDALREAKAGDERSVSRVLQRRYGVTTDQLAARAGELIDATFA